MVAGNRAVVVDYKFGVQIEEYKDKIRHYASLLEQMGYSDVKGYLWYVREGEIIEV